VSGHDQLHCYPQPSHARSHLLLCQVPRHLH
jgi:hypothetical protein